MTKKDLEDHIEKHLDEYEYCPKCGQHIDLDSLEQECEDTEDEE